MLETLPRPKLNIIQDMEMFYFYRIGQQPTLLDMRWWFEEDVPWSLNLIAGWHMLACPFIWFKSVWIFFSVETSSQRYTFIDLDLLNNVKMQFFKKLPPFHMKWPPSYKQLSWTPLTVIIIYPILCIQFLKPNETKWHYKYFSKI